MPRRPGIKADVEILRHSAPARTSPDFEEFKIIVIFSGGGLVLSLLLMLSGVDLGAEVGFGDVVSRVVAAIVGQLV